MRKKWTKQERQYLRKHYGKTPVEDIARKLDRTVASVQSKGPQLGLSDRNSWSSDEIKFLQENYLIHGAAGIANYLNRTTSAVHTKVREVGGGRESIGPRIEWTDKEKEYLLENYQTENWEAMVEHLGRTKAAIAFRAQMLGIKRYANPFPFFEVWTEQSAYVVGFFAADGWISKRGPESIRIGFAQKDRDILDAIAKVIGVGRVCEKSNGMHQYYIQSVQVYEWLCNLFGMDVCRKSHTLAWPSVPDELEKHFIRGAMDGDGSLMQRNDDLWAISYATSSSRFAHSLANEIFYFTGIKMGVTLNKINVWHARCAGIKAVCLAEWLYKDASIALERKARMAKEMMRESGIAHRRSLTPKMYEMFPSIISKYKLM